VNGFEPRPTLTPFLFFTHSPMPERPSFNPEAEPTANDAARLALDTLATWRERVAAGGDHAQVIHSVLLARAALAEIERAAGVDVDEHMRGVYERGDARIEEAKRRGAST
jgi:hypothetical protein